MYEQPDPFTERRVSDLITLARQEAGSDLSQGGGKGGSIGLGQYVAGGQSPNQTVKMGGGNEGVPNNVIATVEASGGCQLESRTQTTRIHNRANRKKSGEEAPLQQGRGEGNYPPTTIPIPEPRARRYEQAKKVMVLPALDAASSASDSGVPVDWARQSPTTLDIVPIRPIRPSKRARKDKKVPEIKCILCRQRARNVGVPGVTAQLLSHVNR